MVVVLFSAPTTQLGPTQGGLGLAAQACGSGVVVGIGLG